MNTPHPDLETLAELADRDTAPASEMAPPAEAATPPTADPQTAELLAHVAGCAACTADLRPCAVSGDTLRALPPVPMPADVAERIEAALLAARASSTPLAASAGGDTVVPLRQRSKPAGRSGPTSSRWRTLPYGAAASIVVLVAVVVVGIVGARTQREQRQEVGQLSGPCPRRCRDVPRLDDDRVGYQLHVGGPPLPNRLSRHQQRPRRCVELPRADVWPLSKLLPEHRPLLRRRPPRPRLRLLPRPLRPR